MESPIGDGVLSLETLLATIGNDRAQKLVDAAHDLRTQLAGRELWHVNSTATGGGVAELLGRTLPIYQALGIKVRWAVVTGPPAFFETTKALGLALYGDHSALADLDASHRKTYAEHGATLARHLLGLAGSSSKIILHDHQTISMAPALRERASTLLWRRHIGVDQANEASSEAEQLIAPSSEKVDARIFSIPAHVTPSASGVADFVIPPVIDPSAPKHKQLSQAEQRDLEAQLRDLLTNQALGSETQGLFTWRRPLAVQVSRWDRLKNMHGVIKDFIDSCPNGSLVLAGPDPYSITDDPEQPKWFGEALSTWQRLPRSQRQRVGILRLPMEDATQNALLVNALQRTADVIVQKSLAEGFGLTVTEAMWKAKAVVGSDVGGIRWQIEDGRSGLLAPAGHSIGPALYRAMRDADLRERLGAVAHKHVQEHFLPDTDLIRTTHAIRANQKRK